MILEFITRLTHRLITDRLRIRKSPRTLVVSVHRVINFRVKKRHPDNSTSYRNVELKGIGNPLQMCNKSRLNHSYLTLSTITKWNTSRQKLILVQRSILGISGLCRDSRVTRLSQIWKDFVRWITICRYPLHYYIQILSPMKLEAGLDMLIFSHQRFIVVHRGSEVFGIVAEHCVLEEYNSKL